MKTTLTLTLMLGLLSVGCGSNPQAESSYSQLIAERQQEAQRIRSLLDSDYARSLEEKGGVLYVTTLNTVDEKVAVKFVCDRGLALKQQLFSGFQMTQGQAYLNAPTTTVYVPLPANCKGLGNEEGH
jgi:hypothetical protein